LAQTDRIQFSIGYDKKYLNWLRTSCVVSITTVATRHTWTADFWTDFEQRIIGRTINEWQNDCGAVSMSKHSIRTRVVTVNLIPQKNYYSDRKTVRLKDLPFLFIRQEHMLPLKSCLN